VGQFGSLYDAMENTNNDHSAWAVMNVRFTGRLTTCASASMAEASASFSGLSLDPSQVQAAPAGFDYRAISDLGDYSRLRMRWWVVEAGLRQVFADRFLFDFALSYDNFRDEQPYLVDNTGKMWGFKLGLNWIF